MLSNGPAPETGTRTHIDANAGMNVEMERENEGKYNSWESDFVYDFLFIVHRRRWFQFIRFGNGFISLASADDDDDDVGRRGRCDDTNNNKSGINIHFRP